MSVLSESANQTGAADTDHQVAHETTDSPAETALVPFVDQVQIIAPVRVETRPLGFEAPCAASFAEQEINLSVETKSLLATPFISHDTSPFENDEIVLLDEWFVSRFYDNETEARKGLNRLFAQTKINFAYGFKVSRHAFYLSDYRYYRYAFSARVGLYAFEESLTGEKQDLNTAQEVESVEEALSYQLSVHHASRTLDLIPKRILEVGHYTLLSLAAGAALCLALHGIMNGWLLG